jgi:hypothetical protein
MTGGFGITFLFINFYTRFFEYFWDDTHKAIFLPSLQLVFGIWAHGQKKYGILAGNQSKLKMKIWK